MSKEIIARLGVEDITIAKSELKNLDGYVRVYDNEGNLITDSATFLIGFEDEEGNEVDENGNRL